PRAAGLSRGAAVTRGRCRTGPAPAAYRGQARWWSARPGSAIMPSTAGRQASFFSVPGSYPMTTPAQHPPTEASPEPGRGSEGESLALPPAPRPAPAPAADSLHGRHGLDRLLTLLVLVLAFLAASFLARNSDLWFHLATGRLLAAGAYRPLLGE